MKSKCLVIFIILSFVLSACRTDDYGNEILLEVEGLKDALSIELVALYHVSDNLLYQKIMNFAEQHPNLEVSVRRSSTGVTSPSAWILGGEGPDDPPDILELTPNQMKMFFHHGKIESLGLRESQYQDYLIHSPDGYVLGIKTKISPLVVYYNRDILRSHGLEVPTNEWDWAQFEQVVTVLKEKGENVYILATPHLLEWVTINRYAGRIVDVSGTAFKGYLDSNEAIQAAEWLLSINTQMEDYRLWPLGLTHTYFPLPNDLIVNNMALAVDYPYTHQATSIRSYVEIMEQNEHIGISSLPGGSDVVNPAMMSGLAIHTSSKNKGAAMALIRYLLEESDDFYRDTVFQTHQAEAGRLPNEHSEEWSVVLQEARRSVPASLMMNEGAQWSNHSSRFIMVDFYRANQNGQPVKDVLGGYAEEFEQQFVEFRKDLKNYYPKFRK